MILYTAIFVLYSLQFSCFGATHDAHIFQYKNVGKINTTSILFVK